VSRINKEEYLLNNALFLLGLAQPAEKGKKKREEKSLKGECACLL
jgi:hypothetical protein